MRRFCTPRYGAVDDDRIDIVTNRPGHLEFISRARRRWAAWRVVESAGIGGVLGAGLGFPVVLVLWWRGEPALLPALVLLGLGVVTGIVWAWGHRPGVLQTAILIDRQMGWNDLLSTAMSSQRWGDPTFSAIVSMQASDRCERIAPAELVLRRLGSRHWGGIGLATSILMTVALLSGQMSRSGAITLKQTSFSDSAATLYGSEKRTHAAEIRSASNRSQEISGQGITSNSDEPDRVIGRGSGTGQAQFQTGDSAGLAAGRTVEARVPSLRRLEAPDNLANNRDNSRPDASNSPLAGQDARLREPIAPWKSAAWESDVVAATRKIENAQVPDTYQDLVREYFTPGGR